jgi:thiamine biosynthesis lipoprotein
VGQRLGLIFALGILLNTWSWAQTAPYPMPSIETKTLSGVPFSLSAKTIAKPTLFVFWATWCRACIHEIPLLKKLYKEQGKNIDIIAISMDEDPKVAAAFVKKANIEYANISDQDGKIADLFKVDVTPTLYVADKRGNIQASANELDEVKPQLLALVKAEPKSITRDAVIMGTNISLVVLSGDEVKANRAIDQALAELKRVEDLMTDWRESELMQVNHQAGKKPVKLSTETFAVLQEAQKAAELTDGAFDITTGALCLLWDYTVANPKPPSDAEIKRVLALTGYKNLVLDEKKKTAFLKKVGMRIGLGGIAKGYAVERAANVLKNAGMDNFAFKAGGDLVTRGKNGDRLWNVVIQDPRDSSKNFALIPVSNGAVSTSGDNERFFMYEGKRYGHIIDPRTGRPADQCQSVTILTKNSQLADVLSTGVFVLGPDKGMKLIEKLEDVEGVIVDANGKIRVSSGLQKDRFGND